MPDLTKMTLEELAREWHNTVKGGGVICDVAIELQRRQAMLDAAEGMAKAISLLAYQAALTPPSEVIGMDIMRCDSSLAAYAAAKETT